MKIKKYIYLVLVLALAIGVIPLANTEKVEAAACQHDWCEVYSGDDQSVISTRVTIERPCITAKAASECDCGKLFFDGNTATAHQLLDVEHHFSYGTLLRPPYPYFYLSPGTVFDGNTYGSSIIRSVWYQTEWRCSKCGEVKKA